MHILWAGSRCEIPPPQKYLHADTAIKLSFRLPNQKRTHRHPSCSDLDSPLKLNGIESKWISIKRDLADIYFLG